MYYSTFESVIVRENAERVSERIIQAIWNYLFLNVGDLKSIDGRTIHILDQGSWNHDAGPDFLNAKIRIGTTIHIGHVEIHHHTSDWRRHGHDKDPRYDRVILHVVLDHDGSHDERPVLEIRPFLADRLERLVLRLRDLEQPNIFCHDDIRKIEPSIVGTWVTNNGWQRFLQKSETFATDHDRFGHPWELLLYEGICDALGYSANRLPFQRLAKLVPLDTLRDHAPSEPAARLMYMQAILLGAAGLLEANLIERATGAAIPFLNRLERIWEDSHGLFNSCLYPSNWRLSRLRPANFPVRRIAGLAKMLSIHGDALLKPFDAALSGMIDAKTGWSRALHVLHVPSFGYWNGHHAWNDGGHRGAQDLVGFQRASEILINVVLPILYARACPAERDRLQSILYGIPSAENNRLIRDMVKQLHLPGRRLTLVEAQGLIQLHGRCHEMNCSACPVFEEIVGVD